jgi:TrmH family RNA methyltransferase
VASARRLTRRSRRNDERRFLAEGVQAVGEALDRPAGAAGSVIELYATGEALARHPEIAERVAALSVPLVTVSAKAAAALSETVTPQGLVAVCGHLDVPLATALAGGPRLVAVLVDVRDPGNAGNVLRTADAAGAEAVVFAGESVDPYNGKCVRASAGSLFHVAVVRGATPAAAIDALRAAGLCVLAADGHADGDLDSLADSGGLDGPTAWLFGNEAHGLPGGLASAADARVRVPILGKAESLNLGAAAAVCLYASAREHRRRDGRRPQ